MYFNFKYPDYLYLLFIIPFIIFFHFYSIKKASGRSIRFANFDAIARIKGIDFFSKNIFIFVFDILIILFLVFSLSGLTLYKEVSGSSFSFVIAIDSSESMGATDLSPSRLDVAKETSIDFINSLPFETKTGIISFAGNTYVQSELTRDKDFLKNSIENIKLTSEGGTDVYEAISISSSLFNNEENKAVILLSDGQINVGEMEDIVKNALKSNIVVHTVGIGTVEGGNTSYGISKLDEDSLKALAYNTKGKYFPVDSKEKMVSAFKEIIPITKKTGAISLSIYMIILCLVFFILRYFVIEMTRISI